jgi:CheY-like chemotaxis protein
MPALRVLVAQDNPDAADSLCLLLRLGGHEPLAARDGVAALAAAPRFQPDVALLDIGMPHRDGFELGRRRRELPGLGGLPLLAMSGYGDARSRRRSEEAGFGAYLVKPGEPSELEALPTWRPRWSASAWPSSRRSARRSVARAAVSPEGAAAVLAKPFTKADLLGALGQAVAASAR